MKRLCITLLLVVPAFAQFSGVSVVDTTNTQAILQFTHTSPASCTVAVSKSPTMTPLVNDVNPALFAGSNLVNRDSANLISGNTARIVVGKRYQAFYAADGNRYSRALQQNSVYYYRFGCGPDTFNGSFSTRVIAMGDTHLDGIPPDGNTGLPAWPSPVGFQRCNSTDMGCSKAGRDTEYVDPQTGVLIKHLVMPADSTIENFTVRAPFVNGAGWTIPANWNTNGSNATITGSTSPLVAGQWNNVCCGVGFSNAFNGGDLISGPHFTTPVILQYGITASLGNPACTASNTSPDCRLDVCVTLDWGHTCAPNAQVYQQQLTTTPRAYLFGSGETYDVMQKPGRRIWSQGETSWRAGGVTCDGSSTVTKVWDAGTAAPEFMPAGSYVRIQSLGMHQVTGNIDALHFTIDAACPSSATATGVGPANGQYYVGGSPFGVMAWKDTASADTLTLSNQFINTFAGGDNDPQYYSGSYGTNSILALANGDPGGLLQLNQGSYSIDLRNGNVGAFMPPAPDVNLSPAQASSSFDNAGNYWTMDRNRNLSKWVYHGDYSTPTKVVTNGGTKFPLWQWNLGVTLPRCSSTITKNCFDNPVQVTQAGLDVLLKAFDSRYSMNPFGTWNFASIEMGKLFFDVRWNNSPGQNYWGWIPVFDPQATSNANGPYGAGCVGQNSNPAGANYLTPGCIVAARRSWDAPGTRWLTEKGPAFMLKAGWSAQQGTIYAFGAAGGGPAVAKKTTVSAKVPCPLSDYATCIQFTVDGDPYDFLAGATTRGVLGSYMVGDLAILAADTITYPGGPVIDNTSFNLLKLEAINGTQLTFACVYGATKCYPSDLSAQLLWMYSNFPAFVYPSSPFADLVMWNYANDPHGTNATGKTIVWDYSTYNAHGFSANSLFSQGGTWSARCTANGGCYNNQNFLGLSDADFAAAVMKKGRDNVTGLTAMMSKFAGIQGFNGACGNDNCQTHPDFSKLGTDPISKYGLDGRPFVGIGCIPCTSDITLVSGTLYKIANVSKTLHPRIFDTQATSGRHVLKNVSGPGSIIASDATGNYTQCQVLIAGECIAGSQPGEVYANVPYLLKHVPGSVANSACYFPPGGFATNTSDNWSINDLCFYDAGMEAQSATRYQLGTFDMVGRTEQALSHMFANGRDSIFTALHPATNVVADKHRQWYYFPAQAWDGMFSTMLMEAPPISIDSVNRTTFQSVVINVTMPAGATGYGVEFGYAEYGPDGQGGFECSPNRHNDPCVAISGTINESMPFRWESETFTAATSGSIAIPALPEHVLYYRPVYFNGSAVVGRGALSVKAIN